MGEKPLRRCRWCRNVLDPNAPEHSELVAGNVDGKRQRRIRPHCGNQSSQCDWCVRCHARRWACIKQGLDPNTGDPPEVAPDQMT